MLAEKMVLHSDNQATIYTKEFKVSLKQLTTQDGTGLSVYRLENRFC